MKSHSSKAGFTLVELAIVLVIIGLIVGGVLVGQDLIRAATIRSVVSDVEKFNAAANTFRGKYNGLPGDLLNTRAVQFGFNTLTTDAARTGAAGMGDGNGVIEGCAANDTAVGCETITFWSDLSRAALIPTRTTLTSITGTAQATQSTTQLAAGILPRTRLRDTALVHVFPSGARNFFGIAAFTTVAAGALPATLTAAATPLESNNIDDKLDDGRPRSGVVTAVTALGSPNTLTAAGTTCVSAASDYNAGTDALASAVVCSLAIRSSF